MDEENHVVPFRCLGHDKDVFYYHSAFSGQVKALTAAQHTQSNLMSLARSNYWFSLHPGQKGPDYSAAAESLMFQCYSAGIFDTNKIRGRGAWYENGKCLLHLGDRTILEGKAYNPVDVPSAYIYEASQPLEADISDPLLNEDAKRFHDLADMLPWERSISALLLSGWCVCGHIGGALAWRPHIWIIGRKGSGKTWVMTQVVRRILGENSLFVQSDTSEAGIRQELGIDSLPVIFDEAEGTDARSVGRLQAVLGLVRQSSSETGGRIVKGSTTGKSVHYSIRSCFGFSSINSSLMQESDNSRVTVLELNQDFRKHDFVEITEKASALLTDEYVRRFYARAIRLAPIIRENAKVFAAAAAMVLDDQRAGDQIGALLAGAYSLHSQHAITPDKAREWVNAQDWTHEKTEVKGQSDELGLLQFIMSQKIKFRPSSTASFADVPIGALVDAVAAKDQTNHDLPYEMAHQALMFTGIKVEDGDLIVSNTSPHVKKLLTGTPWSLNHARVLKRLPGAKSAGVVYFGHRNSEARSTAIPLSGVSK